jgi:ribosomal-protein-alanine N-acetyltransferase
MWSFEAYAAEIERDDSIMIKLTDEKAKNIGFAVGRLFVVGISEYTVELTNIGLRKDFRNRGYGSLLLQSFLDQCYAAGASTIVLEVRVSNYTAIRFYEKFGFSRAGHRRGFYTEPIEDALTMHLTLKERKPVKIDT